MQAESTATLMVGEVEDGAKGKLSTTIDPNSRSRLRDTLLEYLRSQSDGTAHLDDISAASGIEVRALGNAAYNAATRGFLVRPGPKLVQITDLGRTVIPGQVGRGGKKEKGKPRAKSTTRTKPATTTSSSPLPTGALLEMVGQMKSGTSVARSLDSGLLFKVEAL